MFVLCALGREEVPVAAFLDARVGAGAAARVEAFQEFIDRPGALPACCAGGKIPPGR